jgi:hypothetical protein
MQPVKLLRERRKKLTLLLVSVLVLRKDPPTAAVFACSFDRVFIVN